MTREIVIAALGFLLIAGFIGTAVHRWVLAVWHWPLVGSEWRAERRAERLLSVPADTIEDFPGLGLARIDELEGPPAYGAGEAMSADEWEQLGPDEAADVLISELRGPEWHAPEAESVVDTGTLGLFSDLRLLAWDAGRQVDKIQNIRDEWRTETVAPLLAWYQVQLDARRAA